MSRHYRCDINTDDILWIGGDRNLLKFNHNGQNLINNYTQPNDAGRDFVLDKQKQVIIRPWQSMTDLPWKYVVSSYDVSIREITLRWNWHPLSLIVANDDMTTPSIDDKGIVYMSSMSLVFAIANVGITVWTSELATPS
ncbi:unnamed protein product [Rotaria sordida]|uniref:Uncharacterized protein n=1 Tax=Rotaria sordida TaxID=392033 RepID=A0A814NKL3_9BILA|nr:unnamed protein product [Rotaria sordida]CAF1260809.1 unnamed protein product [Rotaria sordida]CAF1370337.1 unnamed protein product [Rotaria sordida]CAF3970709.1 unnamed protein product [Rotaria sordida]